MVWLTDQESVVEIDSVRPTVYPITVERNELDGWNFQSMFGI